MKPLLRLIKRLIHLAFGLCLLAGLAGAWAGWQIVAPGPAPRETEFEVSAGVTGRDLSARLQAQGLVSSTLLFSTLLRAARTAEHLKAGRYLCPPAASMLDLAAVLKQGPMQPPGVMVTIPEGKTLAEVAAILEEKAGLPSDEILLLTRNPAKVYPRYRWLVPGCTAEGYLFPDTYSIADDASAGQVVQMMLDRFAQVAMPVLGDGQGTPAKVRERLVLASLVESEAQVSRERARIASVYLNRIAQGMDLQCDATVVYALGKRKAQLSYEDLKLESPYNTYLHPGLPPGPICNPGLASIKAACSPSGEPYLYYVRNDRKNDGSHVFTRTFREHEQAIREVQKQR